ncbi:uncharacterized protein LOC136025696 [Artemia franciscana]|uniref:uncharacterized protein LOC136025696 n=1 Tax=Artemia franciscana TaxID=6661 RepID=UPI0032DA67B0
MELPEYPWERIRADISLFREEEHLIIVDCYSCYFEVDKLTSMTSKAVIQKMKPHFACFSIPRMLMTNNGPQFSSAEFSTFAKEWGIKHITSSPHHLQSNGLAEKTVQTAKRIIEKSHQSRTEPYLAFLEYQNTPVDNLASPAQLLMSRQLRSMLPAHPKLYKPKLVPSVQFKEARYYHQNLQKKYLKHGTEDTCSLQPWQPVWIKVVPGKEWEPGRVLSAADAPRSYHVETEAGDIYHRNAKDTVPCSKPVSGNHQRMDLPNSCEPAGSMSPTTLPPQGNVQSSPASRSANPGVGKKLSKASSPPATESKLLPSVHHVPQTLGTERPAESPRRSVHNCKAPQKFHL